MEVVDLLRSAIVKPVRPVREFTIFDIEAAFRSLQSGKLRRKVVITL